MAVQKEEPAMLSLRYYVPVLLQLTGLPGAEPARTGSR